MIIQFDAFNHKYDDIAGCWEDDDEGWQVGDDVPGHGDDECDHPGVSSHQHQPAWS